MPRSNLEDKVRELLAEASPRLGLHGGGVELVEISPENVVYLRFRGACEGCAAAEATLQYGLKELIMLNVEAVTNVVAVNLGPATHPAPGPLFPIDTL